MCGPDQKDKGTPMYRSVTPGYTLDDDRIAEMRARLRAKLDAQEATIALRESMLVLARNLRDAAGCALAFDLGNPEATPWRYVDGVPKSFETWEPNCDGRAAPGWER